ncbi:MAG: hypothetical protein U9Q82_16020 [Chloroflexota bacterium]|nr:hypothetical protein [Chloroflexota bacterium]
MRKQLLNLDMETVRLWLNDGDENNSSLGPTMKKIFADMRKMNQAEEYSETWSLVERALNMCDDFGVALEMAETRVECACVVYDLGNLRRAAKLLEEAARRYDPSGHHRGVVLCLLGLVLCQIRGRENDALVAWRQSRQIFKDYIHNQRYLSKERIDWYQARRKEIEASIDKFIEILNNRGVVASHAEVGEPKAESEQHINSESPPPPTSTSNKSKDFENKKLYKKFLVMVGGDKDKVKRLIELERESYPKASIKTLLETAMYHWERDNH